MAYAAGAFGLAVNALAGFPIPLRARELGASFDVIGVLVAAGAVVPAVFSVSSGAVIAWLRSRRAFIVGAAGVAAVSVAFIAVAHYWWLLPLQLVLGVVRIWRGSDHRLT